MEAIELLLKASEQDDGPDVLAGNESEPTLLNSPNKFYSGKPKIRFNVEGVWPLRFLFLFLKASS